MGEQIVQKTIIHPNPPDTLDYTYTYTLALLLITEPTNFKIDVMFAESHAKTASVVEKSMTLLKRMDTIILRFCLAHKISQKVEENMDSERMKLEMFFPLTGCHQEFLWMW
jgi:hypothetical protein